MPAIGGFAYWQQKDKAVSVTLLYGFLQRLGEFFDSGINTLECLMRIM
ncbi:MAG: hypothetical protein HPY94_01160 [Clostridia bacterium]|nr:hypothetical protein [Clostridia bacterium]